MPKPSSLFRKTAGGVLWTGGGQVARQVLHLAIRFILARLLAPEHFGLLAMAMLVIGFTDLFLDIGFGAALIQRKNLTEAHRSTAFWANLGVGALLFALLAAGAPFIAGFFQAPELTPILVFLSVNVVFISIRMPLESLLKRDFKFRTVTTRKLLGTLLGGVTGISLALQGYGVWALVIGELVDNFSSVLFLFWRSPWVPRFQFSRSAFTELWSFSRPLIGGRLFNYFNRNLDTILVARFLDAATLGIYNMSYQFVLLPLLYVTRPVDQVLFSSLSTIQDERPRLRHAYLHAVEIIALVTFPLMTLIALSAPVLVPTVLGEKWLPALAIIPILCVVGSLQSVQNLLPSVFQSTNNTPLIFRKNILVFVVNAIAFSVGVRWGIRGVAIGYLLSMLVTWPIIQMWVLRILGLSWLRYLQVLYKPAIMSGGLIAAWFVLDWFLNRNHIGSEPLNTLLEISLMGILYVLACWVTNTTFRTMVMRLSRILLPSLGLAKHKLKG